MMKYILNLMLFIILFFSCTNYNEINAKKLQGFYKYLIYEKSNYNVIDTLFTVTRFKCSHCINDSIIGLNDLIGPIIITKNKILGIWDIKNQKNNKNKIIESFTIYKIPINKNESWSIEKELGFEIGSFQRNFKCLSVDTIISINYGKLYNNIILIEQKDWIDVGGFWKVSLYGFNDLHQIVYYTRYFQNPSEGTAINNNFLILYSFIPKKVITEIEYQNWVNKNSSFANSWFYGYRNL